MQRNVFSCQDLRIYLQLEDLIDMGHGSPDLSSDGRAICSVLPRHSVR